MATLTDLLTTKIPPHELDAERAILGAALWGQPGALERAQRRLEPGDFYTGGHRRIWDAMERLAARGSGIDLFTLPAELRAQGDLGEVGGPGALSSLIDDTLFAVFIDDYIRLVRIASAKRRAIQAATAAIGEAYDPTTGGSVAAIQQAAGALQAAIDRAGFELDQSDAQRRPQHLGQVLQDVVAYLDEDTPTDLAPTPVEELSTRLGGGMLRGELCYLGGRPGVSKTALALQWALLAAQKGCPTLVISREMKNVALGRRVLAQQANVSATGLRKRELLESERARIARALPRLSGLPVWFDDEAASVAEIRRAVHAIRPRFLVVDYVQLVRAPEAAKQQRRLEVTAVSAALKDLTMRYGCSVLALSSLRRLQPEKGVKGKARRRPAPTLDDLKESGDLEADADIVVLLHHPNPESTDREMIFEKLRDGQAGGSIPLAWSPAYVRFTEVQGEPAAPLLLDPDDPSNEVPF